MKIVADNHADALRRIMAVETPETLLLDTVGDALRAFHGETAGDVPEALVALAARIDHERSS